MNSRTLFALLVVGLIASCKPARPNGAGAPVARPVANVPLVSQVEAAVGLTDEALYGALPDLPKVDGSRLRNKSISAKQGMLGTQNILSITGEADPDSSYQEVVVCSMTQPEVCKPDRKNPTQFVSDVDITQLPAADLSIEVRSCVAPKDALDQAKNCGEPMITQVKIKTNDTSELGSKLAEQEDDHRSLQTLCAQVSQAMDDVAIQAKGTTTLGDDTKKAATLAKNWNYYSPAGCADLMSELGGPRAMAAAGSSGEAPAKLGLTDAADSAADAGSKAESAVEAVRTEAPDPTGDLGDKIAIGLYAVAAVSFIAGAASFAIGLRGKRAAGGYERLAVTEGVAKPTADQLKRWWPSITDFDPQVRNSITSFDTFKRLPLEQRKKIVADFLNELTARKEALMVEQRQLTLGSEARQLKVQEISRLEGKIFALSETGEGRFYLDELEPSKAKVDANPARKGANRAGRGARIGGIIGMVAIPIVAILGGIITQKFALAGQDPVAASMPKLTDLAKQIQVIVDRMATRQQGIDALVLASNSK